MFEQDLTTYGPSSYKGAHAESTVDPGFVVGETYRIIVNEESEYTATAVLSGTGVCITIGNIWLSKNANNTSTVDDGGDYYVHAYSYPDNDFNPGIHLYSRTAGTYSIKIERLVKIQNGF